MGRGGGQGPLQSSSRRLGIIGSADGRCHGHSRRSRGGHLGDVLVRDATDGVPRQRDLLGHGPDEAESGEFVEGLGL